MSTLLQLVEGSMADGRYVVRAELSGPDLEKDIQVTVRPGYLTIKGKRWNRTVPLPAEADSDDVTAGCEHGILTVSIGLKTAG
jgi:HSP20 family molecular chaperone IbpA